MIAGQLATNGLPRAQEPNEVSSDVVDPMIDANLAAGGAEAGFAGKGHAVVVPTAGADVASVASAGIAAEHQALDGFTNVGALVCGDLVFETRIAPGVPVAAEDLTKPVVGSGMVRVTPGG